MVAVSELKPHPKNPNIHSKDQIERLARIIEFQGWRYPIKVSIQSGFITSGHGRLMAAKLKGWTECPVSFQNYDSPDQEFSDVVSDNAIAEWAEMDLSSIKTEIGNLGKDFDIDLLGIKDFTPDIVEHDLSDKDTPPPDGKHFLEVELSSEKEMIDVYNELLSRGLIVRYK